MKKFIKRAFVIIVLMIVVSAIHFVYKPRMQGPPAAESSYTVSLHPSDGPLMAGVAKVAITPKKNVPLAGYGARWGKPSQGVHDEVYARVLALSRGKQAIAIVATDILVYTMPLRWAIKERLRGTEVIGLLLNATHTHSAQGAYWGNSIAEKAAMGKYDQAVFDDLADGIAEAVKKAMGARKPAKLKAAKGILTGYAGNRRHAGKTVDPYLNVIRVDSEEGAHMALIVNYTAHATVLPPENFLVSADFPGYVSAEVEKVFDVGMFLSGALGDQQPWLVDKVPTTFEDAKKMGDAIAASALELAAGLKTSPLVRVELKVYEMPLPPPKLAKECFSVLSGPLSNVVKDVFPSSTVLMALRIGEALMFASPAEMSAELGLEVKEAFPYDIVLTLSHSNDYIGYVLEETDYYTGGYENCMGFFGATNGGRIVSELIDLGRGL